MADIRVSFNRSTQKMNPDGDINKFRPKTRMDHYLIQCKLDPIEKHVD
jgi:hypothetical protein